MNAVIVLSMIGIPCLIGIIFLSTPYGKKWLDNH